MSKKKRRPSGNYVAQNRRARRDYAIHETFEAGIVLTGSEVKSLREGRCSLMEAFAGEKHGELYLFNMHVPEYPAAGQFGHEPLAPRKLLMHKREIDKLMGAVKRKGMALVPLAIYFNARGIAKVQLALAEGKTKVDKRQTIKERDWQRQRARLMREKG